MSTEKDNARLETYKKTVTADDGRRRRQETSLTLRKQKKEEQLAKKRSMALPLREATNAVTSSVEEHQSFESRLPKLVQIITSPSSAKELLEGVVGIRKLLSITEDPPVEKVIRANAVPALIDVIKKTETSHHQIVFETTWALTNIASSQWTSTVVDAGIIPVMVPLMTSENPDVREQASWCLGNIAGDCAEYRDMVIGAGAVVPLLLNVQSPHSSQLLGNVTWALSNLCRGNPKPDRDAVKQMLLAFKHLVYEAPHDVLVDTLWALSYCSDGENERIDDVMELDIHGRLIELLKTGDSKIITPALRTVGNFVTGTEQQTQIVVDAGVMEVCGQLITSPKRCFRRETCWLVSNVAAGTIKQINKVITNRRVFQNLLKYAKSAEWEVRKEALFAVANIVSGGSSDQVTFMVQRGVIDLLCNVLDNTCDTRIVMVAMEAIESILKVGSERGTNEYELLLDEQNGISLLEDLQTHADDDVYRLAVQLLEKYFGEADEVENVAPAEDGDQFGFGLPSKKLFASPEQPQASFEFGGISTANSPRAMRF